MAKKTKTQSSKDGKQLGFPSAISNPILKKYSSNKKLKRINLVKLTVPSQWIKLEEGKIKVPCLKLPIDFPKQTAKLLPIERDNLSTYGSVGVEEKKENEWHSGIGGRFQYNRSLCSNLKSKP